LQKKYLIGLGQAVEIDLPPRLRPVVGLGFAGQIAVECDLGEELVPQCDDPLRRPEVGAHIHPQAEFIQPVVDRLPQFSLYNLSHPLTVERKIRFPQAIRLNADDTA